MRLVWDEPRPANAPPPGWRDWCLVAVLAVIAVLEGVLRPGLEWRVVPTVIAVGLLPTLLWRRTRPLLMIAIAFGVCGMSPLLTGGRVVELHTIAFVLILIYALLRWGSGREALIGLAIVLVRMTVSVVVNGARLSDMAGGLVVVCAASALGLAIRYRARARQREFDQIKLLERERLARDLHDTVAHHVSAMAIRAQAGLATMGANPDAAADALRLIEAEASQALTEMRTMVRALRRDQPADLAPTPQVADIAQLAGRDRAGPLVDVRLDGDVDGVPPPVGSALFRLAQESVTNARRHARHATRIEVHVAVDDAAVRLRVSDDGDAPAATSSGYGLVGMRERADLLGGTCEAGPNVGRGWTVTAVLPLAGSPA